MSVASFAMKRLGAELGAFLSWWIHELRDVCVAIADKLDSKRFLRLVVELEESRAVVRKADTGQVMREFDFSSRNLLPSLATVWPENTPSMVRAAVVLSRSQVLLCPLLLPPMEKRDLAAAIDLLLERELPVPREQVHVAWEVQELRADGSRCVAVAVARKIDVEHLRDEFKSWGWTVTSMGLKGTDGRMRLDLLPAPAHRFDLSMSRRDRIMAWSAAALCVIYTVGVAALWWYERTSLSEPLQNARQQVTVMQEKRSVLAKESEPLFALRDLMRSKGAAEVLLAINASVPLDSWIYQADVQTPASGRAEVKLSGYTPTATVFADQLERSPELARVQLVQAGSAGLGTGLDRVDVTLELEKEVTP